MMHCPHNIGAHIQQTSHNFPPPSDKIRSSATLEKDKVSTTDASLALMMEKDSAIIFNPKIGGKLQHFEQS